MELKTAEEALGKELADIYRKEYQKLTDRDSDLLYMPATDKAKWWCSCGVMNLISQMHCRVCGASIADLSRIMWKDYLQGIYDREHPEEAKEREEAEAAAKAEEEARLKAEEEARQKAEEEARQKAEEEARLKAEEEARQKAEEEARLKAEEEERQKAEEEARQKAEEEARQKAEEEARLKAEEEERQKAEEEARLKAEEEARQKAEEEARLKAEEEERQKAEEEARLKAEEEERQKVEEEARQKAQEEAAEARREAEERARARAEADAAGQVGAAAPEEAVERRAEPDVENEDAKVTLSASRPAEQEPEKVSSDRTDQVDTNTLAATEDTHNEYTDTRLVGTWDASTYFDKANAAPPAADSVIGFPEVEDELVAESSDVTFPDDKPEEVTPDETASIEFPGGEDDLADSTIRLNTSDEEEENMLSITKEDPEPMNVLSVEDEPEPEEEPESEAEPESMVEPEEDVEVPEAEEEPEEPEAEEEPDLEPEAEPEAEEEPDLEPEAEPEVEEEPDLEPEAEPEVEEEPDLSGLSFGEQPVAEPEPDEFAMDIDDMDTHIAAADEYEEKAEDDMPEIRLEKAQEMPGFGVVQTLDALPEEDMVEFLELPSDSVQDEQPQKKKGLFGGLFGKKKKKESAKEIPEAFSELKFKEEEPEKVSAPVEDTEDDEAVVDESAEELTFVDEALEETGIVSDETITEESAADEEAADEMIDLPDADEMIDLSEEPEEEQQIVEFPEEPEEELPELSSPHDALTHFENGITEDLPMNPEEEVPTLTMPEPEEEENTISLDFGDSEDEDANLILTDTDGAEDNNLIRTEEDETASETVEVDETEPEVAEAEEPEIEAEPEETKEDELVSAAEDGPKVIHDEDGNPTIVFPDAPIADSQFGDLDELDFPDATIPEAPMPDPINLEELPRIEFPDGPQLEHVMNPEPDNKEKARPFRNPGAAEETPSGLDSEEEEPSESEEAPQAEEEVVLEPEQEPEPEEEPTEAMTETPAEKSTGRYVMIIAIGVGILAAFLIGFFVLRSVFGTAEADNAVEAALDSIGRLEGDGLPTQEDFNKAINDYNAVPYDRKAEVTNANVLEKYKDVDLKTVRDIATRLDELNDKTPFADVIALESEFEKLTMQEKQFVHGEKLDERKQLNDTESTALKAVSNIRSLLTSSDNFKPTSIKVKDDTGMSMAYRMEISYSYVDEQGTVKEDTTYLSMMSINDDVAYNAAVNAGKPEAYTKNTKDMSAYNKCESEEISIDCDKVMYYLDD